MFQPVLRTMQVVVDRLLERQKEEMGGKYPESIAVVLWGTDNIKTYGESLAQVSWHTLGCWLAQPGWLGFQPGPVNGSAGGGDASRCIGVVNGCCPPCHLPAKLSSHPAPPPLYPRCA